MAQPRSVAIVGGGAAGMMAAVALKETVSGLEVLLFEKNSYLGAKVMISGGGRCNVTTGVFEVKKLLQNYPRGAKFLMSAFYRFPPEKVIEWFESHGVFLKIEEDLRVFPVSNNGKDIVGALEKVMREQGVKIFCRSAITEVEKKNDRFLLRLHNGTTFFTDYLLLTPGGNAYRHTGSSGDGYHFAQKLGHTVTSLAPSLHSFVIAEKNLAGMAGVTLKKVELTLISGDKARVYKRCGPLLFSHRGVTGPAVFALSSQAAHEPFDVKNPLSFHINFFPDYSKAGLMVFFQQMIQQNPRKNILNFLDFFLPRSLCYFLLKRLPFDSSLKVSQLRKEQLLLILQLVQEFSFSVIGRSAGDEFVTAGGVSLDAIHTNTMGSKICPGLYFAGEILDVDGFTGGFNLQSAWATGRLAGESIGNISMEEV